MDRNEKKCRRMNAARMNRKQVVFYSTFIIPPSSFLLLPVHPVNLHLGAKLF
jgi:hypothetical protein